MPYKVMSGSGKCPAGKHFAVVKEDDNKVMGCHATEDEAMKQMRALYANEKGGHMMSQDALYLIDLTSDKFLLAEGEDSCWVHALPIGEYKHPKFGIIKITTDRVVRFAEGVANKVRGIDPSINKMHGDGRSGDGEAAGWVKKAESRPDGLWLFVEWVKETAADIRAKKWRYFSAEFTDLWKDPQGKEHSDVIMGGALTNRPWMKNLVPINLSESTLETAFDLVSVISGMDVDTLKGGKPAVGLDEGDLKKIIEGVTEAMKPKTDVSAVTSLSDVPELKALAEENPMVALLMKQVETQNEAIARSAVALREREINSKLAEFDRSKIVLTPVARDLAAELAMGIPAALADKFWTLLSEMKRGNTFLVELGERAGATVNYGSPTSATKIFNENVEHLMKEDPKLSYADAVERVAAADRVGYTKYREEQYAGVSK